MSAAGTMTNDQCRSNQAIGAVVQQQVMGASLKMKVIQNTHFHLENISFWLSHVKSCPSQHEEQDFMWGGPKEMFPWRWWV